MTAIEELLNLCRVGKLSEVEKMIQKQPELVNAKSKRYHWTPLYKAVRGGCEDTVLYLLQQGADPEIPTVYGERPLHEAADSSKLSIASLLLDFDADPNATQSEGNTPLHLASIKGDVELVQLLLAHEATPDLQNVSDGRTPLHYAVQLSHSSCARVLLSYGASVSIADNEGNTPLMLSEDSAMLNLLIANPQPQKPSTLLQMPGHPSEHADSPPVMSGLTFQSSISGSSALAESKREEVKVPLINLQHIRSEVQKPVLRQWLLSYKLEHLYEILIDSGYDDVTQMSTQLSSSIPLDEEILRQIGIPKSGHRRRLLGALFESLKTAGTSRNKDRSLVFSCCTCTVPAKAEVSTTRTLLEMAMKT